jgi:hypothetical protein
LVFCKHHRVENTVHPLLDQVQDMSMHQFRRVTDVLGHHCSGSFPEQLGARGIGELDFEPALDQQLAPEGEVLVRIHRPRQTNRQGRPGVWFRWPVEEQLELAVGQTGSPGEFLTVIGVYPFTAVAGVENTAARKD